jgi:hypothetical protein
MLSEIFILRLEAMVRVANASAPRRSDTRFVPVKPSVGPAKDSEQAGKRA